MNASAVNNSTFDRSRKLFGPVTLNIPFVCVTDLTLLGVNVAPPLTKMLVESMFTRAGPKTVDPTIVNEVPEAFSRDARFLVAPVMVQTLIVADLSFGNSIVPLSSIVTSIAFVASNKGVVMVA